MKRQLPQSKVLRLLFYFLFIFWLLFLIFVIYSDVNTIVKFGDINAQWAQELVGTSKRVLPMTLAIATIGLLALVLMFLKKSMGWRLAVIGLCSFLWFSVYMICFEFPYDEMFEDINFSSRASTIESAKTIGLVFTIFGILFLIPFVMLWLLWFLRQTGVFNKD